MKFVDNKHLPYPSNSHLTKDIEVHFYYQLKALDVIFISASLHQWLLNVFLCLQLLPF